MGRRGGRENRDAGAEEEENERKKAAHVRGEIIIQGRATYMAARLKALSLKEKGTPREKIIVDVTAMPSVADGTAGSDPFAQATALTLAEVRKRAAEHALDGLDPSYSHDDYPA